MLAQVYDIASLNTIVRAYHPAPISSLRLLSSELPAAILALPRKRARDVNRGALRQATRHAVAIADFFSVAKPTDHHPNQTLAEPVASNFNETSHETTM